MRLFPYTALCLLFAPSALWGQPGWQASIAKVSDEKPAHPVTITKGFWLGARGNSVRLTLFSFHFFLRRSRRGIFFGGRSRKKPLRRASFPKELPQAGAAD